MRATLLLLAGLLAALISAAACGPPAKASTQARAEPVGKRRPDSKPHSRAGDGLQHGKGTWYGADWHGKLTASGERYDRWSMTAAHKTLPMNTIVRVTNTKNGRSVTLRINNRGPYARGRIIDVSEAAANKLDMVEAGVVPVTVEVIKMGTKKKKKKKR